MSNNTGCQLTPTLFLLEPFVDVSGFTDDDDVAAKTTAIFLQAERMCTSLQTAATSVRSVLQLLLLRGGE